MLKHTAPPEELHERPSHRTEHRTPYGPYEPYGGGHALIRDGQGTPLRLLPWTTPEGALCYLSTDDSGSRMSRLADEMEDELLTSAECVLADTRPLTTAPDTDPQELRRMAVLLAEALRAVLRIAASRGARLPGTCTEQPCEHRETEGRGGKTFCRSCGQQIYL